ncbi:GNAT family N-acetyltransferase [Gorillibacterium massiliense]|uniref:GNAT family N-acetyltransferase n=1 Tax=Gorillibacterium massiliense TaxID=1280390 RepID=UPI0004B87D23|nr:GNAT family N-acetyltransferase [Gorillibacterium massiliense]
MSDVKLRAYHDVDTKAVAAFLLSADQLQFTAMPGDSLALCQEDDSRHPMVICTEDKPVGFFVLHDGPGIAPFSENPNAVLLRGLLVDQRHQGKGYAYRAMTLVPDWVSRNFPGADEIVLAVNKGNLLAQRLYLKCGFEDRGNRRMGQKGEQLLLHFKLDERQE